MTIMLKILAVLGYILLAIILLLVWVIIVPRHFWLEYDKKDGFTAKMNIGFFKLKLYPLPNFIAKKLEKAGEKAEDVVEEGAKEDEEAIEEKTKKKPGPFDNIEFSFDLVKDILATAKGVVKIFLKGIYFRDVSFTLPLYDEDAYRTQQLYANTTTAFYTLNIFLQQYLQIYYKSPIFVADFANQHENSLYFYCKITSSPSIIISVAIFAFKQYRKILKKNKAAAAAAQE